MLNKYTLSYLLVSKPATFKGNKVFIFSPWIVFHWTTVFGNGMVVKGTSVIKHKGLFLRKWFKWLHILNVAVMKCIGFTDWTTLGALHITMSLLTGSWNPYFWIGHRPCTTIPPAQPCSWGAVTSAALAPSHSTPQSGTMVYGESWYGMGEVWHFLEHRDKGVRFCVSAHPRKKEGWSCG